MKRRPVTIDVTPHKVVISSKPRERSIPEIIADFLLWFAFWLTVSAIAVIAFKGVVA